MCRERDRTIAAGILFSTAKILAITRPGRHCGAAPGDVFVVYHREHRIRAIEIICGAGDPPGFKTGAHRDTAEVAAFACIDGSDGCGRRWQCRCRGRCRRAGRPSRRSRLNGEGGPDRSPSRHHKLDLIAPRRKQWSIAAEQTERYRAVTRLHMGHRSHDLNSVAGPGGLGISRGRALVAMQQRNLRELLECGARSDRLAVLHAATDHYLPPRRGGSGGSGRNTRDRRPVKIIHVNHLRYLAVDGSMQSEAGGIEALIPTVADQRPAFGIERQQGIEAALPRSHRPRPLRLEQLPSILKPSADGAGSSVRIQQRGEGAADRCAGHRELHLVQGGAPLPADALRQSDLRQHGCNSDDQKAAASN